MKIKTAGFFILNNNLELLVCHPTNHPIDYWSITKGKIEPNETPLEAAIRETHEECNLDLTNHDMVFEMEPVSFQNKRKILYPFIIFQSQNDKIDWNVEIRCNSRVEPEKGGFLEMDQFKWIPIKEALNVVHETQVKCLNIIIDTIESQENEEV